LACFVCVLISIANRSETIPDASAGVCLAEQCEGPVSRNEKNARAERGETIRLGEQGAFHLSIEDDELLTEQGILYNQIGTAAS